MLVDDVDDALDELVADGTVVEREIETSAGTTTYYRLATGAARERVSPTGIVCCNGGNRSTIDDPSLQSRR